MVVTAAVIPGVVACVVVVPVTVVVAGVGLTVGVVAAVVEATVVAPAAVVVAGGVVVAETVEVLGFGVLTVRVVETTEVEVVRWVVEGVEVREFPCARETKNKCR